MCLRYINTLFAYAIILRDIPAISPYAMRGTDLVYGAVSAYAMRGTDLAYGATSTMSYAPRTASSYRTCAAMTSVQSQPRDLPLRSGLRCPIWAQLEKTDREQLEDLAQIGAAAPCRDQRPGGFKCFCANWIVCALSWSSPSRTPPAPPD
eukprot:3941427-Rhodomonas_salina.1